MVLQGSRHVLVDAEILINFGQNVLQNQQIAPEEGAVLELDGRRSVKDHDFLLVQGLDVGRDSDHTNLEEPIE